MNSENTKPFDPHRQQLNIPDKTNLKRNDKYVALANINIYYTWKKLKENAMNLNFQLQQGKKNLNYLVDHILYQICKTIASI